MDRVLLYRAGPRALRRLQRDGLAPGMVRAVAGPASGPKWLALAGLDRALLGSALLEACPSPRQAQPDRGLGHGASAPEPEPAARILAQPIRPGRSSGNSRPSARLSGRPSRSAGLGQEIEPSARSPGALTGERILLAGASAGAWRMLAFACEDPLSAHRRLLDGYVSQVFARGDAPAVVSRAYRDLLADVVGHDVGRLVDHPVFDLAIHTARLRLPSSRPGVAVSFLAAAVLNAATARATDWLFERVLFHSAPSRFLPPFAGRLVALDRSNLLAAALASGTVPFYLETVRGVPGAPRGGYVDGGLTDYHLRQRYIEDDAGIVLLPHYRRRILPRWLDRFGPSRRPAPNATANLLQLYPSPEFVAALPDGRVPDRHDFKRFAGDPRERIRRWQAVAEASDALGEQLRSDLKSGRLPDLVQPL